MYFEEGDVPIAQCQLALEVLVYENDVDRRLLASVVVAVALFLADGDQSGVVERLVDASWEKEPMPDEIIADATIEINPIRYQKPPPAINEESNFWLSY